MTSFAMKPKVWYAAADPSMPSRETTPSQWRRTADEIRRRPARHVASVSRLA